MDNYLKLLEMAPQVPETNYYAALMDVLLGNSEKTIYYLEKALTLSREGGEVHDPAAFLNKPAALIRKPH
ncbi:MAG: hypothetical protein L0Y76_12565, partial [Ignavibacteria bacterium]|nr:hypothetical protein [Ignavibacteria bacterium]